jgi:hypothetical protein
MNIDDWVLIIPDRAMVSHTAKALLAVAKDPRDVRTEGTGNEFFVAPYVATAFNGQDAYEEKPKPKRRARAPKKKEGEG